jgi:hypothetical protein
MLTDADRRVRGQRRRQAVDAAAVMLRPRAKISRAGPPRQVGCSTLILGLTLARTHSYFPLPRYGSPIETLMAMHASAAHSHGCAI